MKKTITFQVEGGDKYRFEIEMVELGTRQMLQLENIQNVSADKKLDCEGCLMMDLLGVKDKHEFEPMPVQKQYEAILEMTQLISGDSLKQLFQVPTARDAVRMLLSRPSEGEDEK